MGGGGEPEMKGGWFCDGGGQEISKFSLAFPS